MNTTAMSKLKILTWYFKIFRYRLVLIISSSGAIVRLDKNLIMQYKYTIFQRY